MVSGLLQIQSPWIAAGTILMISTLSGMAGAIAFGFL